MIAETGHYALILALGVAIVQMLLPLLGARFRDPQLAAVAAPAAQMQFILVAIAFIALMTAYVTSDFSVENVWRNSHSAKPLLYKISGVWGNHEGSMVLWVLILALFGAAVATFGSNLPRQLKANVLAVQGSIAAAFLLFIVTTSNPFTRLSPAPFDGQGLNPVLQDPALAFHPPFLYAGYVGFSMAFSFAVAALIEGRIDAAWARWVRPWTLAAWMCLTLGIAMGSWWAYYELGWGGFWFWDPVENASFMPWLAGTALLHSALVMEKRDALKVWTILLAIITFSLSLMGTFLVRSGVLTSVHAFAVDPARGIFILAIMGIFIGGALTLFAWRAPLLQQGGLFAPISREGALVLNNLLLTTACAAVFVGTLYPLALEALTGDKISVGPPFFNLTFAPLIVPLLIAVPFGPLLAWKRGDLLAAAQRLMAAACVALAAAILLPCLQPSRAVACAARHRPWHLADHGRAHRDRLPGEARASLAVRGLAPLTQSAARRLRVGARSCRPRARCDRHRRDDGLAVGSDLGDEARRERRHRRLHARLQRRGAAPRAELSRAGRSVRGDTRRQARHRAHAVEARVQCRAERHHRSRHPRELARRSLCRARRSAEGRRLQHSPLFQSAGASHLARRAGDVLWRRGVALRPALAGRRAEAGAGEGGAGRRRQMTRMPARKFLSALLLLLTLCVLLASGANAVQPDEVLPDPALEARARAISEGLRCLVCQNQSIDDSDAPLAKDLRLLVRERLKQGDSDQQVVDFIVARYGEFVLLKPKFSPHTLLLWLATPAVFAAALLLIWLAYRRRQSAAQAVPKLSVNEERRLKRLLDQG